jgi:hypothetical protein
MQLFKHKLLRKQKLQATNATTTTTTKNNNNNYYNYYYYYYYYHYYHYYYKHYNNKNKKKDKDRPDTCSAPTVEDATQSAKLFLQYRFRLIFRSLLALTNLMPSNIYFFTVSLLAFLPLIRPVRVLASP